MQIKITARKFNLKDELREFVEKETSHFTKYFDGIIEADVILSWEKFYRLAEIKLTVQGTVLNAKERSEDIKKAVHLCVDKLERQLIKYKEKLHEFEHQKASSEIVNAEVESESYDDYEEEIEF